MKALIVEDDPDIRSLLGSFLSTRGHEVTTVGDAEAGQDLLETNEFPLVILDWALPGMDGVQLCRWLRTTPKGDSSFVLLTTGREEAGTLPAVLDAGANDFLPKPFTIDSLNVRMAVAERQVEEIRKRKRAEQQLAHQALHDPLTDLPNRALLRDRLQQAIARADRSRRPFALFVMDLDGFKDVNDTYGHASGDELLIQVGARLRGAVRASDTVARVGGDEFALVLSEADAEGARSIAEKVLALFATPFLVDGNNVSVGASVGIALYPAHGPSPDALMRSADSAMYRAKRDGSGPVLIAA